MGDVIQFKKMTQNAYAPVKATRWAAGHDLRSAYSYIVPPNGKEVIATDLRLQLPLGCYGRIAPRSGLAAERFIDVGAGVIDSDYAGNVKVVLFNFGSEPFYIHPGDRVAQLICEKIKYPTLVEVSPLQSFTHDVDERGANGFGWSDASL